MKRINHYRQLDRDTQRAIDLAVGNAKFTGNFQRVRREFGEVVVTPLPGGKFSWAVNAENGLPIAEGIRG